MEKDKVINVANNSENSSNKDLVEVRDFLIEEYTETKNLIIDNKTFRRYWGVI